MATLRKFKDREEIMDFLQNLPMNMLMQVAADAIYDLQTRTADKIILTEEQFNSFFRIRGYKENGERETRGRVKKDEGHSLELL